MQMYSGKVDYDIIAKVKKAVDIPVIANGDIVDEQSAAIMFEKTNCDAIMIGRRARQPVDIQNNLTHTLMYAGFRRMKK